MQVLKEQKSLALKSLMGSTVPFGDTSPSSWLFQEMQLLLRKLLLFIAPIKQ